MRTQQNPRLELPLRLRAVAAMVEPGRPMADIGCDHALLPAALVSIGTVPSAIGVDRRPGPLRQGRRTLDALGLAERIDLRQGDGLAPLLADELGHRDAPAQLGTLVVAGMGARRIEGILTGLRFAGRLVVQPNADLPHLGELRAFLVAGGWHFEDEELVADRAHLYVVMALRQSASPTAICIYGEEDLALGPLLRGRQPPHPLFAPWIARQRHRNARTIRGLEGASGGRAALAPRRRLAELLDEATHGGSDATEPPPAVTAPPA